MFDLQPPTALEAEMALLGCMILDPKVIPDVMSIVRSGTDFYDEKHGHIYTALVSVFDRSNALDLVLIVDALRAAGKLELVGGEGYLVELAESVPAAVNAPHYARIVAEKSKLRRLIDAAGEILYEAYHAGELGPDGAREVLDSAEMRVFEIAQAQQSSDPQALAELLEIELRRIEAADFEGKGGIGIPTGFFELDGLLQGLQPGELLILAARPSMGKTALALNLAEQIALGGVPIAGAPPSQRHAVGIFSLEMSKVSLVQRLLSARSGVSGSSLRGGSRISDEDLRRLLMASEDLKNAPIFIDDSPNLTVLNLRARARRMVAQHGVRCLMIDYLQLMSAPGAARESRQVEVSAISRGVKALARELNVPVICLSQLNRASESREGNRPRMSDLRESGSIEQDADVIMLLHREDYYHVQDEQWKAENPDKIGVAEVIVAKQRNGPTGVVKLVWDNRVTRFRNFDAHARDDVSHAADFAPPPPQSRGPGGPSRGPSGQSPPWAEPKAGGMEGDNPFDPPRSSFAPGKKTGPISNHRDGGGPDRDGGLDPEA
jgi:replicative DNA helicase